MKQSKLIELLTSFSARDWRRFQEFLASPYFNKQPEMANVAAILHENLDEIREGGRETFFSWVFPNQPYDDKKLNHLNSQLLQLAEQFLGFEKYQERDGVHQLDVLEALSDRRLEKHYQFQLNKTRKIQEQDLVRDANFHLMGYQLENLEADRFSKSAVRKYNTHVQRTADHLDRFYLAEKLRCTCYMLTSQLVLASSYNLELVGELEHFLDTHTMPADAPVVEAYFRVFKMLTQPEAESDFILLRDLLFNSKVLFNADELAELYQYAINFCNLQIMKGQEAYVQRALDLYVGGIDQKIILEQGVLSPWHFKNIIKLALRTRQYIWTESFIRSNTSLLDPGFREDAYHYNLAELFYYTREYDQAMKHLQQVEFTDVHYNLGSKEMLCKIYFETDALDALESLLHAFKTYLLRNKTISNDLRRTYMNFIRILQQVPNAMPERKQALRHKIDSTSLLAAKTWLRQIVN
ncbi:MAG: hypothetical protein R2792_20220 [Saprospiraceae bacterium]